MYSIILHLRRALYGSLLALLLCSAGCHGLLWGNLLVIAMSIGIFVGTVSLTGPSRSVRSSQKTQQHKTTP